MKKRLIFGGSAAWSFAACCLLALLILAFDIPGYLLPTLSPWSRRPPSGCQNCGRR